MTQPDPAQAAKLAAIRSELPAVQHAAFLNTGSSGPLTRRGHAAMQAGAEGELLEGRMGKAAMERFFASHAKGREDFAALLGCEPTEVALTHSTTEGMNIALHGLDWRPGDRLVTAVTEHPGAINPVAVLAERRGVQVIATDIGLPGVDAVEALNKALESGPRAVVLSHVSFTTGIVHPVAALCEAAHRAGATVIIDGAQSVGMIEVDVHALGVDAYAGPGQKWLCGPAGTGVLYVAAQRLEDFGTTFAGYMSGKPARDGSHLTPPSDASRFEALTMYGPSLAGLAAAMAWLASDEVGWPWAFERIAALGRYCHAALGALDNVTMVAPMESIGGLVSFVVAGLAPEDVTERLRAAGFFIRHVTEPDCNRVSTGFYNTTDELDRLAAAVGALQP